MTVFEEAWEVVKAEMLLWPKELNNYRDPDTGEPYRKMPGQFRKPGPPGFTQLFQKPGLARPYVSLPNVEKPGSRINLNRGKESQERYDGRLTHDVIGTDVHEDVHRAIDMIGESSENPYVNELPAHIAEALQFTRRPRETINPNDKVLEYLDRGMSPTEIAVKLGKKMAMMHHQVSGSGSDTGLFSVVGPQKFTYDRDDD